jgi:hypothetical protein
MNWFANFLLAIFRPALGLIILAGLLLYWVLNKKLPQEKFLRIIFFGFTGIIIIHSLVLAALNYWLWKGQLITQQLLPPYSPISYVLGYSWQHYWFESTITIIAAVIIFFGIYFLNKKFENNLFYDEEKYLAALGILATGWPNCLIYLCLVLFLGIFSHLIFILFDLIRGANNSLRKVSRRLSGQGSSERSERENEAERQTAISSPGKSTASFRANYLRLSLLHFWLPCALLVLLLSGIINRYIGINQFNI